jgi:hypothetical protein
MPNVLYIKYQPGDNGTRPINPCTNFWNSPSVWLTDANGNGLNNQAVVGQDNVINVQVDSLSKDSLTGVKVQVWVDDFTLGGVGPDAVVIGGTFTASGVTSTVPTAVSSNAAGLAQIHWTPNDAYLINSPDPNQGHVCIGANTYVEGATPEGAIKTSGLLDVCGDQHHAWKNIAVIKTSRIKKVDLAEFALRVVNVVPERAEFLVGVTELDRELAMGPLEKEQLLTAPFVDLVREPRPDQPGDDGDNGDDGGDDGNIRPGCLDEPLERKRLRRGGQLVLTGVDKPIPLRPAPKPAAEFGVIGQGGGAKEVKLVIEPGDRIPLTLQANLAGEPGDVHAFDITQTAGDGRIVGGARIVAVNVPGFLGS